MEKEIPEILGYIASLLIVVSLIMSSIVRLRIINTIGAIFFVLYGISFSSYPVIITNSLIILINIYYLHKIYNKEEKIFLHQIFSNNLYIKDFINFYEKKIKEYAPSFQYKFSENSFNFFITRNIAFAGIFIGEKIQNNTLLIKLDFVTPEYRDFKIAKYIYNNKKFFIKNDIKQLKVIVENNKQLKYFCKMGFVKENENVLSKVI